MPGDPYWANVVLLMGFEGADGSTGAPGMTDESPAAHGTGTVAASTAITNSHAKFGATSLNCFGNAGFPASSDWNLSNGMFTIETFVWVNGGGTQFFVGRWGSAPNLSWVLYVNEPAGQLGWNISTTGSDNLNDLLSASGVVPGAKWQHVAVDYDGVKYRLYCDGATVATSTTPRTIFNASSNTLGIGSANSGGGSFGLNGWLDELRITKGVARYASDSGYTAPTAAFPRGPLITNAQLTQIAAEDWTATAPIGKLTQLGIEEWTVVGGTPTIGLVTQIAVEEWVTVTRPSQGFNMPMLGM